MINNDTIIYISLTLLFSAFFSGMEIAYLASNKLRIELDRQHKTFASKIITIFVKKPAEYITTMLVGNNLALVIYGALMADLLQSFLLDYMESDFSLLLSQTVISTIVILVAAEFIPKAIFRLRANAILNFFALPVYIFYIIFYPITYITKSLSMFFIRVVLKKDSSTFKKVRVFGKIDLDNLIQEHIVEDEDREDKEHEVRLFRNALDFSNIKLRECMIPRTEIYALPLESSLDELKQMFIDTGLSRILIYKGNIDNIIGYVHSSVLFRGPENIKSSLSKIIIVPETMQAQRLLKVFTKEHKSIAVVVDEFGGTSGIVSIEDIVEEIFGEIEDEHDVVYYIEKQISGDEFYFSGRLEIDYINEKYDLAIPEDEDFETLAGWILSRHGDIPPEKFEMELDGFVVNIRRATSVRIEEIYLKVL